MGGVGAICVCLFVATLAGVRWLGKVVYVTYFVAVGLLITLLVRVLIIGNVAEQAVMFVWERTDWNKAVEVPVGSQKV